eukprot:9204353-Ditylum_brightwellii.AAC.1
MFLYPCGIYVGSFVGHIVGRCSCRLVCHLVRCWGEALDKCGIGCLGYVRLPNSPISITEVSPANMCKIALSLFALVSTIVHLHDMVDTA